MVNPTLTKDELAKADALLGQVRAELERLAGGDAELLFAYRRRIAKMLVYDERSGTNERRKLKRSKRVEQGGRYADCDKPLPPSYNVLDRTAAVAGYTPENTRLICEDCDRSIQRARGYR